MELVQIPSYLRITEGSGLKRRGSGVVAKQKIRNCIPGSAQARWRCATAAGAVLKYERIVKTIATEEIRGQIAFLNPVSVVEAHRDGVFSTDHRHRIRELPHRNVAERWVVPRAPGG